MELNGSVYWPCPYAGEELEALGEIALDAIQTNHMPGHGLTHTG